MFVISFQQNIPSIRRDRGGQGLWELSFQNHLVLDSSIKVEPHAALFQLPGIRGHFHPIGDEIKVQTFSTGIF